MQQHGTQTTKDTVKHGVPIDIRGHSRELQSCHTLFQSCNFNAAEIDENDGEEATQCDHKTPLDVLVLEYKHEYTPEVNECAYNSCIPCGVED